MKKTLATLALLVVAGPALAQTPAPPAPPVWHQTWVDSTGTLLVIEGASRDGVMTLTDAGQPGKKDPKRVNEIAWSRNADGTVRQHWRVSVDGGATWTTAFDGKYVKKP